MNLADLLRSAARGDGSKTALAYGETSADATLTYADIDAEADRVAAGLARRKVSRGDRVGIAMPNIPHFLFSYFGILRAGAVAIPLNPMLTVPEITRILEDSTPTLILGA